MNRKHDRNRSKLHHASEPQHSSRSCRGLGLQLVPMVSKREAVLLPGRQRSGMTQCHGTKRSGELVQDVYKSWQLPERAPRAPPPPHVTQPFDATSAYQENYPAHEPQPRWRRLPETWKGEASRQHLPCIEPCDPCNGRLQLGAFCRSDGTQSVCVCVIDSLCVSPGKASACKMRGLSRRRLEARALLSSPLHCLTRPLARCDMRGSCKLTLAAREHANKVLLM